MGARAFSYTHRTKVFVDGTVCLLRLLHTFLSLRPATHYPRQFAMPFANPGPAVLQPVKAIFDDPADRSKS